MLKTSLAAITFSVLAAAPAAAAATAEVAGYDALLRRTVARGVVDYRGIARPEGRQALTAYLKAVAIARIDGEGNPRSQLAAWINAYNALAIQGVLDGGSPATLWGRYAFFRQAKHPVFGRELSLEALENEVIRKEFQDPRIHFALVCASKSCPPLRAEAYSGPKLDQQLDDQAFTFLADVSKNRFERAAKTMWLSSIFKWYQADFERAAGSVPAYVARFAPPAERGWLTGPGVSTKHLDYDWSLNGKL